MKFPRWLVFSFIFFLFACQSSSPPTVQIIDGNKVITLQSTERLPLLLLTHAGLTPQPGDRVLVNGVLLAIDQPLPSTDFIQLQLRHAFPLTVNSPEGQKVIQSAALTVGQALSEAGYQIYSSDRVNPPASTPIAGPLTIDITPAREMSIFAGGKVVNIRSAAGTVGEVLAEAGIPLMGLDISSPSENEAPPPDGQIRVIHVTETVKVALESIPFTTQVTEAKDVPIGQQKILQPGVNGLAMVRTRVRYEDGQQVSKKTEGKTVLREPQTQIVASGSQVVLAPVPAGNIPYDYWIATQMYATVYTPCQSGTGGCSYNTASGARAGYGIVAVDYSVYSYLAGMKVYIPGYGIGTIGDTGGGPVIESMLGVARTKWIDLGFNDGQVTDLTGWVTVYFLAPAPVEIPYFLK